MSFEQDYTVIIRGKEFLLTQSQIEFDSPNYFTSCFLGNFSESQSRTLKLSRDPDLFQIVINYLCGYTVLPLNEGFAPAFMTPSTVLANLRADAIFYQLDGLVEQCDALKEPLSAKYSRSPRYLIIGSQYNHAEIEDVEDQMSRAINPRVWKTWVEKDVIEKEPLMAMERPGSRSGFDALREVAAVERFVRSQVPELDLWNFVGWHIQKQVGSWEVSSKLMVVLENVGR
ncbi:hypothetical protein RSOLAG1IB_09800 [Rhizoctonia solani AG-1 IB]|uniref:BTB domain-containing protein n=1 Tax=Thanatephorus cucumeris (strain AG1-IB / isolate 7/3/14) TaxID=1108050 RepID=A0A0B7FY49_THACB|nr:hypothetical protein RSOLAG1IB_09800 [Rhizoctonia solani AG-1 IB]